MSNRNRLFQQFHAENNHGSAAQDEITEEGIASENHADLYDHFISASENVLKGCYLKLVRSRNAIKKTYQLLPTEIIFPPDEVFGTYIKFLEDLHIDTNASNILIEKVNSYIQV